MVLVSLSKSLGNSSRDKPSGLNVGIRCRRQERRRTAVRHEVYEVLGRSAWGPTVGGKQQSN